MKMSVKTIVAVGKIFRWSPASAGKLKSQERETGRIKQESK